MTQPKPNPPLNWNAIGEKERDVLVHLEVMGGSYSGDPTLTWMEPPNYSTSISDAMKVLERFLKGEGSSEWVDVRLRKGRVLVAIFGADHDDEMGSSSADTFPEAVCKAALRASGLTIE